MDLLQETLDALDDGILRFDADLRLVAWNRTVGLLVEFPPTLLRVGTPFLDFVEFNLGRGEYGPGSRRLIVRQRLASLTDSYTRHRPNGTVVHVRSKAMPDGGVLKVFSKVEGPGGAPSIAPALSAREREVLLWAAQGKTAWETASILGLSPKTVEFHLASCGRKLGTATKAQTILAAARGGLLPL